MNKYSVPIIYLLIVLALIGGGIFLFFNRENQENIAQSLNPQETKEKTATKTFKIEARNFSFSQNEIRVNRGDLVRIELTSAEGFHDWAIDEFNAQTSQVNTGETSSVEFVADKAGTFEYYCSVGRHRQMGMVGNLVVE